MSAASAPRDRGEPSVAVIVGMGAAASVGLLLAVVANARINHHTYCTGPIPVRPTGLFIAATVISLLSFLATVSERIRSRWAKAVPTVQLVSFVALLLCLIGWIRWGSSPCGD